MPNRNVNPVGPRGVYDEANGFAEAMTTALPPLPTAWTCKIVCIFNTYGLCMRLHDGLAVPVLPRARPCGARTFTILGSGTQTRSFCYVTDLVDGILRLADSKENDPVNLGNPHEMHD